MESLLFYSGALKNKCHCFLAAIYSFLCYANSALEIITFNRHSSILSRTFWSATFLILRHVFSVAQTLIGRIWAYHLQCMKHSTWLTCVGFISARYLMDLLVMWNKACLESIWSWRSLHIVRQVSEKSALKSKVCS